MLRRGRRLRDGGRRRRIRFCCRRKGKSNRFERLDCFAGRDCRRSSLFVLLVREREKERVGQRTFTAVFYAEQFVSGTEACAGVKRHQVIGVGFVVEDAGAI